MIKKVDDSHLIGIVSRLTDKVNELVEIINKQQGEIERLKQSQFNLDDRTSGLVVVIGKSKFKHPKRDLDLGDIKCGIGHQTLT